MSTRSAALAELRDRVEDILKAGGYETDAGALVFLGEQPTLGPSDPAAAIAIMPLEDTTGYQGVNVDITLPVDVQAIVKADVDDPWVTVEAIIGDIKKAVETDHDLDGMLKPRGLERGSVRPLDREPGSEYVGAAVQYRLRMVEGWGKP